MCQVDLFIRIYLAQAGINICMVAGGAWGVSWGACRAGAGIAGPALGICKCDLWSVRLWECYITTGGLR